MESQSDCHDHVVGGVYRPGPGTDPELPVVFSPGKEEGLAL